MVWLFGSSHGNFTTSQRKVDLLKRCHGNLSHHYLNFRCLNTAQPDPCRYRTSLGVNCPSTKSAKIVELAKGRSCLQRCHIFHDFIATLGKKLVNCLQGCISTLKAESYKPGIFLNQNEQCFIRGRHQKNHIGPYVLSKGQKKPATKLKIKSQ